jgi:predicted nuclease of restriction endonuclease-like (RecB) superfamily
VRVNAAITRTYWGIGRRIVEQEQHGRARAGYGEELVDRLATDLTARFGRGFSRSNLKQMRGFYLAYRDALEASPEAAAIGPARGIRQTMSGESRRTLRGALPSPPFPLPWSHYVRLLSVRSPAARRFYETEALRGGWTVRQLDRQIGTQFYERTALSKNKAAMLSKGERRRPEDAVTPEEEIKDPLVLEFLGLKDEYSESDIEEALILRLEQFLLELGGDFTFTSTSTTPARTGRGAMRTRLSASSSARRRTLPLRNMRSKGCRTRCSRRSTAPRFPMKTCSRTSSRGHGSSWRHGDRRGHHGVGD